MDNERVSARLARRPPVRMGDSTWYHSGRPSRELLTWFVASVLAVCIGAASVLNPGLAGLLIFAVGVCVLIVLPLAVTLGALVLAFALPLTQLDLGIDPRLLAPALLVPLSAKLLTTRRISLHQDVALRLVPLCAMATASIAWSQDAIATGAAVLALMAVVTCLFLVPASSNKETVLQALRWLVSALIVLSAVAALTPLGQLGGRSRGIFGNPNTLAVLLALAVPLLMRGRWRLLLPLAVVLAYSTASRAGTVAMVVGVLFYVLSARATHGITRTLAVLSLLVALTAAIVTLDPVTMTSGPLAQPSEISVFRYENSREFEWANAIRMWWEHPLIGHGFGASKIETGSSYLKLLVDLGLLGLLAAAPFLLLLVRRLIASKDSLVVGSTAAGLVSGLFEAWLLTAGSAFFLLFCLVIQAEKTETSD